MRVLRFDTLQLHDIQRECRQLLGAGIDLEQSFRGTEPFQRDVDVGPFGESGAMEQ